MLLHGLQTPSHSVEVIPPLQCCVPSIAGCQLRRTSIFQNKEVAGRPYWLRGFALLTRSFLIVLLRRKRWVGSRVQLALSELSSFIPKIWWQKPMNHLSLLEQLICWSDPFEASAFLLPGSGLCWIISPAWREALDLFRVREMICPGLGQWSWSQLSDSSWILRFVVSLKLVIGF